MKSRFLVLMFLVFTGLYAQQIWQEPVDVINSTFYDYLGESRNTELTDAQGNTYVFIQEYQPDGSHVHMHKFSPSWQELWQEPLSLNIFSVLDIIETSDGNLMFAVKQPYPDDYYPVTLYKINPEGQHLWPSQGIPLPNWNGSVCRMLPDPEGGAHLVFLYDSGWYWGYWRYLRINATGNFSFSPALELMDFDEFHGYPRIQRLPNDRVLVTIDGDLNASLICIEGQNQVLWRKNYSGRIDSVTSSGGITYAAVHTINSLNLYKYNPNGVELWAAPLSLPVGSVVNLRGMSLSADEANVFLVWKFDDFSDRLGKVNAAGEILWVGETPFSDYETIRLEPDALGGLFLYGYYQLAGIKNLWIHHLDSQGQVSTQPMCEYPILGYSGQVRISARLRGNDLRLIYGCRSNETRGVKVQTVNFAGETGYAPPGLSLIEGNEIITAYHTLGHIGDKALVVWGQRESNGDNFWMKYQVFYPDGSPVFAEAQALTNSAVQLAHLKIYSDTEQSVQIVWRESNTNPTMKLQILNSNGQPELESGGHILASSMHNHSIVGDCLTGFWDGKLFIAYRCDQEIYLDCFVQGVPQWNPQGMLIANPDEPSLANKLLYLDNYYLVWYVRRDTTEPVNNVKCTRFNENGLLEAGFNPNGLPAAIPHPAEWGISGSYAVTWGNKLFVQLFHLNHYWDPVDDWWEYTSSPAWQLINPDGTYQWGDWGLAVVNTVKAFPSNDALYAFTSIASNGSYFDVLKLNESGYPVWTHRVPSPGGFITASTFNKIDNGSFIFSYINRRVTGQAYQHDIHFGYFTAEEEFNLPADNLLNTYNSELVSLQQSVAQNSVYLMTSLVGGQLCQLFSTQKPTAVDDPGLPAIIPSLTFERVHPNPFDLQTNIQFKTGNPGKLRLEVYNLRGQRIKTLIDESIQAGLHDQTWDGKDTNGKPVASGVYFLRLAQDGQIKTRKLLLLNSTANPN